eukprot:snap_masked-scaffold_14-processed-gene-0.33-mRNA-1 protein AED:1.00 eAED:1.00 QI:0/-1/0/0/-1/1/1/0/112
MHQNNIENFFGSLNATQKLGKRVYRNDVYTTAVEQLKKEQLTCLNRKKLPINFFWDLSVVKMFHLFLPDYKGISAYVMKDMLTRENQKGKDLIRKKLEEQLKVAPIALTFYG